MGHIMLSIFSKRDYSYEMPPQRVAHRTLIDINQNQAYSSELEYRGYVFRLPIPEPLH